MVGLMQLPLYHMLVFWRFMHEDREQVGCFPSGGLQQPPPRTQESSDCENAKVTFIEQDPRKTKVLVSGLKGP